MDSLTRTQINQLLARNVVDVTTHFSNRMKVLYKSFKNTGILSNYKTVDHFFRIEFQQRGSPHVHSLLWLEDDNGKPPPKYDSSLELEDDCVQFIDSVICGQLPDESDDHYEQVKFFQTHSHTSPVERNLRESKSSTRTDTVFMMA